MRYLENDAAVTSTSLERKPGNWLWILLFGLLAHAFILTACQPVSAPHSAAAMPGDSGGETVWAMVPISAIEESALAADTLILGQWQEPQNEDEGHGSAPVVILGQASAFPALPNNAVALVPDDEVSDHPNVGLSQSWNLGDDQVLVMVGPEDLTWDIVSSNGGTFASVSPSHAGTISPSGALATYASPSAPRIDIWAPGGTDPVADVLDPIHLFCIICGCCSESILEMDLPTRPVEIDDLVLTPLSLLDESKRPEQYWVLSMTGSKKAPLTLQPNSYFETPPEAGLALVAKSLLSPDVEPVGDLFVRGQTSLPQYSGRFLLDSSRVLSDSVTFSDDGSLLSFDLLYDDSLAGSSTGVLHLEAVCPECDIDDYCRIDPIGCICMYTPLCSLEEINN